MQDNIVTVKDLKFVYNPKSPFEKSALKGVDVSISSGELIGVIGHTGSGKSTLIQHLNGLLETQSGELKVFDFDMSYARKKRRFKAKKAFKRRLRALRGEVGMVFQYPEYQLFEDTVAKDVAFGPKNLGVAPEKTETCVREALELVGLNYEDIKNRSPFDLSGGQKRRVAIAGIVAMQPKLLILDEPTAGLDPQGKKQILELILRLKEKCSPTVIIISHDMDEIAEIATRVIVMNDGKIAMDAPPAELFENAERLIEMGLDIPTATKVRLLLAEKGLRLPTGIVTKDMLINEIIRLWKNKTGAVGLNENSDGDGRKDA